MWLLLILRSANVEHDSFLQEPPLYVGIQHKYMFQKYVCQQYKPSLPSKTLHHCILYEILGGSSSHSPFAASPTRLFDPNFHPNILFCSRIISRLKRLMNIGPVLDFDSGRSKLLRIRRSSLLQLLGRLTMALSKATNAGLPLMNLLRMRTKPILEQLCLEERLLRNSAENWCIVNDGTKHPNIVMGVSGKLSELVELKYVLRDQVPVIRRFSGGGTVIVDNDTIFVSFICNKDSIPGLQPYPQPIMSWSGQVYREVLQEFGDFHLRENDYAFDSQKFGGNAQSIIKNRWIHHTSFLWDYNVNNMKYLKLPTRAPKYRSARSHDEFLCRMKEYVPSRLTFIERTIASLGNYFSLNPVDLDEVAAASTAFSSGSTKLLTRQELEEAFSNLRTSDSIPATAIHD